jgi:hypothetical protein
MKKLLLITGLAEAATGVALMVVPELVGRLLLGADLAGASVVVARVAGIALLALGVACWPGCRPLCGMLTYSALVTIYLGIVAIGGQWVGRLLWPAVGLHAGLTILLARAWFAARKAGTSDHKIER